jgi:hypothetical protein
MTGEELLRESLVSLEVNDPFTEAVLGMRDGSRLCFRHSVGERWARAVTDGEESSASLARAVLSLMSMFRLNAKHLDVRFADGSCLEARFSSQRETR